MEKAEGSPDAPYVVGFDYENGKRYVDCVACCLLPCATGCLLLPCIPCVQCCSRKELHSQECKVTDKRIEYEGGWLNHTSKRVPLDRIQDVSITQGCVEKCFNVRTLNVQTAGNSGGAEGAAPEISLQAVKDAEMIRDIILQRRDQLVFGGGVVVGAGLDDIAKKIRATNGAAMGATSCDNTALVHEIRELKESVQRIEKHVGEGLQRMGAQDLKQ